MSFSEQEKERKTQESQLVFSDGPTAKKCITLSKFILTLSEMPTSKMYFTLNIIQHNRACEWVNEWVNEGADCESDTG